MYDAVGSPGHLSGTSLRIAGDGGRQLADWQLAEHPYPFLPVTLPVLALAVWMFESGPAWRGRGVVKGWWRGMKIKSLDVSKCCATLELVPAQLLC